MTINRRKSPVVHHPPSSNRTIILTQGWQPIHTQFNKLKIKNQHQVNKWSKQFNRRTRISRASRISVQHTQPLTTPTLPGKMIIPNRLIEKEKSLRYSALLAKSAWLVPEIRLAGVSSFRTAPHEAFSSRIQQRQISIKRLSTLLRNSISSRHVWL